MSKFGRFVAFSIVVLIGVSAQADLKNADRLRDQFQLSAWQRALQAKQKKIKVAVLDNGFQGYKPGLGSLPLTTTLVEGPINAQAQTAHGLAMAEILWATMGKYPNTEMLLVNTNGFSNFKHAIDTVIKNQVDVVLYSQVWSFGGNFDGTGLINAQVSRATDAGILWINAAGNFGSRVYDRLLNQALKEEPVFFVQDGKQPISLTLSWNDFSEDESQATDQDLDFQILDSTGVVVGESALKQKGAIVARGSKGVSGYAREKITLRGIPAGEYRVRLKNISANFHVRSRIRILIESASDAVVFASATADREVFPPADHPDVITIGEDSLVSSRSMSGTPANKPDLVLPTFGAEITSLETPVRGSSVSAAIFSGLAAMMKVLKPSVTKTQIIRLLRYRTPAVRFDGDLQERSSSQVPQAWKSFFGPEMKLTQSAISGQYVVLVPYDPSDILFRLPIECRRTQSPWAPLLYTPIRVTEFLSFK